MQQILPAPVLPQFALAHSPAFSGVTSWSLRAPKLLDKPELVLTPVSCVHVVHDAPMWSSSELACPVLVL